MRKRQTRNVESQVGRKYREEGQENNDDNNNNNAHTKGKEKKKRRVRGIQQKTGKERKQKTDKERVVRNAKPFFFKFISKT